MEISDEKLLNYRHKLVNIMQKFKRTNDGIVLASLTELLLGFDMMIDKAVSQAIKQK
jgi:hypothetical protein